MEFSLMFESKGKSSSRIFNTDSIQYVCTLIKDVWKHPITIMESDVDHEPLIIMVHDLKKKHDKDDEFMPRAILAWLSQGRHCDCSAERIEFLAVTPLGDWQDCSWVSSKKLFPQPILVAECMTCHKKFVI